MSMVGDGIGVTISMEGGVFFVPWHAVHTAQIIGPGTAHISLNVGVEAPKLSDPIQVNGPGPGFVKKGGKR